MKTKLFYVSCEDEGDDLSSVVEATSPEEAKILHHKWLVEFTGMEETENPEINIFELPEKTGVSRYFNWHTKDGVIEHSV